MAKPKGLGRGLDSIFFDNTETESNNTPNTVRLADIRPRADQPRKSFDQDALEQLARSIAEHGLIQPIVVRTSLGGFYEIIAGERRWRAAKMAGLSEIPAVVFDGDDMKAAEVSLIENIQREDLNPMEEALGYQTLIENFGMTQEDAAVKLGKSQSAIANKLRLLKLDKSVQAKISEYSLTERHARALLRLEEERERLAAVKHIAKHHLNVAQAEQ